ncbi:MAG: NAD(P)-dependent glycerol-3-phosphate dehydrogenase [Erysipelotrichaceae bacterium]|nr:NAD(P)-dependent glycerol-3-phosphate dehydrogenase [Erysipelotrichaceae bacterium]
MKVTVIGGGSWGSALARILGDNGHDVIVYEQSLEIVNEINIYHTNKSKLPIGTLPLNVSATACLSEALIECNVIVIAVPTKVIRCVLNEMNNVLTHKSLFVNASKGLEPDTFLRVSEIVYQEINNEFIDDFVALTGPSHAEEVINQLLTTICAVSTNKKAAKLVQSLFNNNKYFRVYTSYDLVGAELCGALKNIYAIASGMLTGIGLGDNAKAGLISRALVEMRRFIISFGAHEETIYGLTGLGDLVVTTTSLHSRNFQAGYRLATGKNLEETISSMTMVVEGARTVVAAYQYARVNNLETPIIDAVYDVLYNKKPVKTAINQLMKRSLKDE